MKLAMETRSFAFTDDANNWYAVTWSSIPHAVISTTDVHVALIPADKTATKILLRKESVGEQFTEATALDYCQKAKEQTDAALPTL